MTSFAERFDSYFNARRDYSNYLEAKGYREEGDRTLWEPQYEVDIEPDANYGPGAMQVGELDEFYQDNDEPNLGYDDLEEPNLIVGSEEITYEFPDGKVYVHYFDADSEF